MSFSGLTITTAVGSVGGIQLGADANNQWLTSGYFRTGNNDKYLLFNPAGTGSLTVNGTVIQNGTVAGISAGTNKLYIGVGNHANADTGFYVDSSGNFSLKDKLHWTAATNSLVIDGTVSIGGTTASTVVGNAATGAGDPATRINAANTTITGNKIRTGSIDSNNFSWPNTATTYSSAGTRIDLDGGQIISKSFRIDGSGNASFAGSISSGSTVSGSTISGSTITTGTWGLAVGNRGLKLDSDGYITGSGSGVKIRSYGTNGIDGATGWSFYGDLIDGPKIQCAMYAEQIDILQIGTAGFIVKGDTYLYTRISTDSSRKQVQIRDDNHFVTGTNLSSIRYKENVKNLDLDYKTILKIEPVSFHYKKEVLEEGDPSNKQYGFIAEQVDGLGLQELVNYDKENRPDSIKYDNMSIYLLKVCQEQEKTINNLLDRVGQLESGLV